MNHMTQAVLKAGLITPNMLREIKRFSVTLDPDAAVGEPKSLEEAARIVSAALESEGYSLVRETDLDALTTYTDQHLDGTLHVEVQDEAPVEFEVTYCVLKTGEYLIAWSSDSIENLLLSKSTYLLTGLGKAYFSDVRELFFGARKAFIACALDRVE